jgi:Protein of unknown function (DUF3987)
MTSSIPDDIPAVEEIAERYPDQGEVWFDPGVAPEAAPNLFDLYDPWARYPVPPFPLDALPPVPKNWARSQARVIGADPSGLAMSALAACSAAIDHRFSLKLMRNGFWTASPRLWVLLVADPSFKKTPIINAGLAPLEVHEHALRDAWEAQAQIAQVNKEEEPPKPPRFVVMDTTVEKLADLMTRSDRGICVKRDEIAGWIGGMEKYSAGKAAATDRAFWLQAFDGGAFTVDRVQRGETRVKNLSVTLLGGIQPDRLRELHGLTSDGLLQRFIPVMLSAPKFPEDAPISTADYKAMVLALVSASPLKLSFDDGALEIATGLRQYLFDLEQASGGLTQGLSAFVGKLPGIFGSLALILHVADHCRSPISLTVGRGVAERAALIVREFILSHASEFYRSADTKTNGDRLKAIASWILVASLTRIRAADLTANVSSCRGLALWDLNQRVSPLVAAGWLEAEERGPVTRAWKVNPEVFRQFQERAAEEEKGKARLAALMGSPRKGGR